MSGDFVNELSNFQFVPKDVMDANMMILKSAMISMEIMTLLLEYMVQ